MKTKLFITCMISGLLSCNMGNLNQEQTINIISFIDEGINTLEKMKIEKSLFQKAGYPEHPKSDRNMTKSQFELAFRQVNDGLFLGACEEINNVYLQIYEVILDRKIKKAYSNELESELPGKWEFLEKQRKEYAGAGLNAMLGSPKSLFTGKSDAKPYPKPASITEAVQVANQQIDEAKQKLKELKSNFAQ